MESVSGWLFPIPGMLILAAAMVFDAVIGDPRPLYRLIPHPVVWIGKPIGFLEKRLNRETRNPRDRLIRGGVVVLLVVLGWVAIGLLLDWSLSLFPQGWLVEVAVVGVLLAGRSLHDHVRRVGKALRENLEAGRAELAHIVSRDTNTLDRHGVARSAIESLSENFSDGLVAPLVFYALFGLPGILAYKAINTLDSMIGYKTDRYREFGFAAAKLDDLANWIPARLSGLIICLAACFTPTAYPVAALGTMFKDAKKHKSPNAGWPEAAFAGALNIALGGPRSYPGGETVGVWIGEGRARLEPRDIDRSRGLYGVSCALIWFGALLAGAITLAARL